MSLHLPGNNKNCAWIKYNERQGSYDTDFMFRSQ